MKKNDFGIGPRAAVLVCLLLLTLCAMAVPAASPQDSAPLAVRGGFEQGGMRVAPALRTREPERGARPSLLPHDSLNCRFIGHCNAGRAWDVALAGSYAYVADVYKFLHVIDVSDPANPQEVGHYATQSMALGVAVASNYAYVAGWDSCLYVIDVSDPANPQEVGRCTLPWSAEGVAVAGNYAYVADGYWADSAGLRVIDVSDPAHPQEVGHYAASGASDVAVAGNYAYVTDAQPALLVFDVSDPVDPQEVGYYDMPYSAPGVAVAGNFAYVADYDYGLQIIEFYGGQALPDLELLPLSTQAPATRLFLANTSVLFGNRTDVYPWTDKEFIGAAVRNTGSVPIDKLHVRAYVDGTPVGPDTVIEHMAPMDTVVMDRMWDLPGPVTENRLVEIRIDPDNTIQESNEGNNSVQENVSIFYARQDQSPFRPYDLRTDTYGQFENFEWSLYDLWYAFTEGVLRPEWTQPEQALLIMLYTSLKVARGHCYGMAGTSIHYFDRALEIPPPYSTTFSLPLNLAQPNINAVHVTQILDAAELELLYCFHSPTEEYQELRHQLRDSHEPVMILANRHATTAYKVVERGPVKIVYVYDNNEKYGPEPGSISPQVAVFDVTANGEFSCGAYETSWYKGLQASPWRFPYGFPYFFWSCDDPVPHYAVLARRPHVAVDVVEWARKQLWDIVTRLGGNLIGGGRNLLIVACPVRGLVTDNHARRIGFVGDSLMHEVPGATLDTSGTAEVFLLPDSLHYTVATAAYDTGRMDVCLLMPVADSLLRLAEFDSIPLHGSTKATVSFARGDTSFPMQVDWDGTGGTDTTLYPNFNDTLSLRTVGVAERQPQVLPVAGNQLSKATVVRGALWLGGRASAILTDIAGRKVADLHLGDNDLRLLAPGVYFVTDRAGTTLRRIVLQR